MTDAYRLMDLVQQLTLDEKISLLSGQDNWSIAGIERIGLRSIVTSDGPVGVRGTDWDDRKSSANTPSPTALAATWNDDLMEQVGNLLAEEADKKGVDVILAPTLNLHRTPLGGRHFECFSEDPVLTGGIASSYVRGIQDRGKAACLKHFVANDQETDRLTVNNLIDERTLRELYFSPFEQVEATVGPWAYMSSYNQVNGEFMTESPLQEELLRDEWGTHALVMSDWGATRSIAPSINSGLDLAMPGPTTPWDDMKAAVESGEVTEESIDISVLRYLTLALRVGALRFGDEDVDGDQPEQADRTDWTLDEETRTFLRRLATESFVLARNTGVLPLADSTKSIAVLGPNARSGRAQGGGSASVFPDRVSHPLEAIRSRFSNAEISYAPGVLATDRVPVADGQSNQVDGKPGIVLEFVGANGEVLDTRHHRVAQFNWVNGFGPDFKPEDVSEIRGRTTIVADETGTDRVGMSAVGRIRLVVAGETKIDLDSQMPGEHDFVEVLMTPPQHVTEVSLQAGESVDIEFSFISSSLDEFGSPYWGFQLNIDEPFGDPEEEIERAVEVARNAEVAVVIVGTTEEVESEGYDREDLYLPGRQDELVRRVAEVNDKTIVLVNAGAPVLMPWFEDVAGVMIVWFPGQEMGNAIADVLSGDAEPGGRMPTTWPKPEAVFAPQNVPEEGVVRYEEGIYIGYRAYAKAGIEPQIPFGYGKGYTTWEFGEAIMAEAEVDEPDDHHADGFEPLNSVTFTATNTGDRPGKTVAQVYMDKLDSEIDRPERWLVAYAAIYAEPGETKEVTFQIPRRFVEYWNGFEWEAEGGDYEIAIQNYFSPVTSS